MTAKDGKGDPQEMSVKLFPIDSKEQVQIKAKIADRCARIRQLRQQLAAQAKPLKEEITRLERSNEAALAELE